MERGRKSPYLLCALGVLLTLLPFLPVLLDPSRACLYRDISNVWLPYKVTWATAVTALGRIPHWDPFHAGGFPFVADLNYGPLYPLNLLFLLGSSPFARKFTYWIVLHHALIFVGRFALLRDLRIRPSLSLAGALSGALAGAALSSDDLVHNLAGQAAVGFFFLFWWRALRREQWILPIFAASVALAWPVYAGDPQYSYMLAIAAALSLVPRRDRAARAGKLTALAAAPQLMPTAHELLAHRRLLDQATDADRLAWSLHPLRLAELLFPLPFGASPDQFRFTFLTGGVFEPFLFSIYAGVVATAFAALALWRRRRWRLAVLVVSITALALGSHSPLPLYSLVLKALPLWGNFRYPERLAFWLVFLLQLAGFRAAEARLRLKAPLPPWIPLAAGAAAIAFGTWLATQGASPYPAVRSTLIALALWGIFRIFGRAQGPAIAALVVLDMAPVARNLVWTQPVAYTSAELYPWARKLLDDREKNRRGPGDRFFSALETRIPPPAGVTENSMEAKVYGVWAGFYFNAPSAWGIPLVRGHTVMAPERPVLQLTKESTELMRRALDIYGARYLLVPGEGAPSMTVNRQALPFAFFPPSVEPIASEDELGRQLRRPGWRPLDSALIESALALAGSGGPPEIDSVKQNWDEVRVSVHSPRAVGPRWLVLNEAFDPAWRVTAGSAQLPLSRANGWAMAVPVPALEAGRGLELRFLYRDRWYEGGLFALALWAAALACALARRRA